ncbi:VOC family protein [Agrilactobacillus fermenti]|uniref:VOC family protein n=1 Tax=Agrilactobacillus fermenti TaxID=2586909 RepID=UPI003A5B97C1
MEILNWDHSMLNIQDLDQAIADFKAVGVIFARGGRHEAWGTANALGYFGLNYIELITVDDRQKAQSVQRSDAASVYDAIQDFKHQRERFNTVAIRTSDIQATWQRLRSADIKVGPIQEGQRRDEQGHLISWTIFFIDDTIAGLPYPFFINWQMSDAERTAQLKAQQLLVSHSIGNILVHEGVFKVSNPQAVAERWAQMLNSTASQQNEDWIVPIQERQFRFIQGDENHLVTLRFKGATVKNLPQTLQFGTAKLVFEA